MKRRIALAENGDTELKKKAYTDDIFKLNPWTGTES